MTNDPCVNPPVGRVLSVNVGRAAAVPWGRLRHSAIDKRPVQAPVWIGRLGLQGDEQADRRHHGGAEQAVYAYAREDLDAWQRRLGRRLPAGSFGENLTTAGIDVGGARIGERWQVGDALLEVTSPRIPCSVFQGHMGEARWVRRFTVAGAPGAYLRVLREGEVAAGEGIEVVFRPDHHITVAFAFRALTIEPRLQARLLEATGLHRKTAAELRARMSTVPSASRRVAPRTGEDSAPRVEHGRGPGRSRGPWG